MRLKLRLKFHSCQTKLPELESGELGLFIVSTRFEEFVLSGLCEAPSFLGIGSSFMHVRDYRFFGSLELLYSPDMARAINHKKMESILVRF